MENVVQASVIDNERDDLGVRLVTVHFGWYRNLVWLDHLEVETFVCIEECVGRKPAGSSAPKLWIDCSGDRPCVENCLVDLLQSLRRVAYRKARKGRGEGAGRDVVPKCKGGGWRWLSSLLPRRGDEEDVPPRRVVS